MIAIFDLHDLVIEDIQTKHQRDKAEQYGDSYFVVSRMIKWDDGVLTEERVNIFAHPEFLITIQDDERGDCLTPIFKVLENSKKASKRGIDYLLYMILDALVDEYFPVLEKMGDLIEELEDELIQSSSKDTMGKIHLTKRHLMSIRRGIWPQRETINTLIRNEHDWFEDDTVTHLFDVYDHAVQMIELLESYRDVASGLVDLYLASISNRMNEVMKALTIMSTIFIPLTFIVGVYGMNFKNMPELHWHYGYFMAWILMIAITAAQIGYFRHKGWLRK